MKYYLYNHSGCLNHGCEAIVRGTMNIIENSDSNSSFVLSSYNPESDEDIDDVKKVHFAVRGLTKTEKFISALNVKMKKSDDYAWKKMYSPMVEQARDCDVCLSVGGDTYCYGDNRGVQILTEELKKSGKKTILWGASIGEKDLSDEKLENLRKFDGIFARESITYNLLKEKNANDNIYLYADPAFCMEREEMTLPQGFDKDDTLGINISPLIGKSNPKIFEITDEFIKYAIDNTTLKIVLVPHVVEENNNDYEFMLPLYEKYKKSGRVIILPPDLNAKQYKGYVAKLRFFIGARTHATIAAYSCGVPTVVLGYSVKARGIATDLFGNDEYVLDANSITESAELTKALALLLRDEGKIKENLMKMVPLKLKSGMESGKKLINLV